MSTNSRNTSSLGVWLCGHTPIESTRFTNELSSSNETVSWTTSKKAATVEILLDPALVPLYRLMLELELQLDPAFVSTVPRLECRLWLLPD